MRYVSYENETKEENTTTLSVLDKQVLLTVACTCINLTLLVVVYFLVHRG